MDALQLIITRAGLNALVDAQSGATEEIVVTAVGLTATPFVAAPTLIALPGEFKRIDAVAGDALTDSLIHLTAQDVSADAYDLTGIGLFLEDGTLFAAYSHPTPLFRKVAATPFLLALDVSFTSGGAAAIEFGDPIFTYPPATEGVRGVARIATDDQVAAELDDQAYVTSKKLGTRLAAFFSSVGELFTRTISGGGLVTGGGTLEEDRTLTVTAATSAQALAGTAGDLALTPASLGGLAHILSGTGTAFLTVGAERLIIKWMSIEVPGDGTLPVSFAAAFPNACFGVLGGAGLSNPFDGPDFASVVGDSWTAAGFTAFNDSGSDITSFFIALGK